MVVNYFSYKLKVNNMKFLIIVTHEKKILIYVHKYVKIHE